MGTAIVVWGGLLTVLVVAVVASATRRRRRRRALIGLYENPGAIDVVKAAEASHHLQRARGDGPTGS